MKYDIEKIMSDEVAKQWTTLCLAENTQDPAKWFKDKSEFWRQNSAHLESFGFSFKGEINHALDTVLVEKLEDLQGSLLLVRVGTDAQPAATTDIELAQKIMSEALAGVEGVRVIISHHAIDIKKVSLPQLRKLTSEVLTAGEDTNNRNVILDLDV